MPVFNFGVRKVAWMVMAEECEVSGAVVCVVLMNSVEMSSENVLPDPRVEWDSELVVNGSRLLGNGEAVRV